MYFLKVKGSGCWVKKTQNVIYKKTEDFNLVNYSLYSGQQISKEIHMMDCNNINILLLEDPPGDISNLITELLNKEKSATFILKCVNNFDEIVKVIGEEEISLIFLDIPLSSSLIHDIFNLLYNEAFEIPVIILSDIYDEDIATLALSKGIQDYLIKQELNYRILSRSMRYALERNKIRIQLRDTVEELNKAIENIKTLSGLLPMCAHCKKIRDDEGYWQHVEKYLSERADVEFSHGICPTCMKMLYPEFSDTIIKGRK